MRAASRTVAEARPLPITTCLVMGRNLAISRPPERAQPRVKPRSARNIGRGFIQERDTNVATTWIERRLGALLGERIDPGLGRGLGAGLAGGVGSANGSATVASSTLGVRARRWGGRREPGAGERRAPAWRAAGAPARTRTPPGSRRPWVPRSASAGRPWSASAPAWPAPVRRPAAGCAGAASGARRGAARPVSVNVSAIPNTNVVTQRATTDVPLDLSLRRLQRRGRRRLSCPLLASPICLEDLLRRHRGSAHRDRQLVAVRPAGDLHSKRPAPHEHHVVLLPTQRIDHVCSLLFVANDSTLFTVGIAYRLR